MTPSPLSKLSPNYEPSSTTSKRPLIAVDRCCYSLTVPLSDTCRHIASGSDYKIYYFRYPIRRLLGPTLQSQMLNACLGYPKSLSARPHFQIHSQQRGQRLGEFSSLSARLSDQSRPPILAVRIKLSSLPCPGASWEIAAYLFIPGNVRESERAEALSTAELSTVTLWRPL